MTSCESVSKVIISHNTGFIQAKYFSKTTTKNKRKYISMQSLKKLKFPVMSVIHLPIMKKNKCIHSFRKKSKKSDWFLFWKKSEIPEESKPNVKRSGSSNRIKQPDPSQKWYCQQGWFGWNRVIRFNAALLFYETSWVNVEVWPFIPPSPPI